MSALLVLEILLAVFLILLTSFFAYWIYLNNTHYWVDKNVPFESPFPFLGTFSQFVMGKAFHDTDQELCKKHGRLFGAYAGTQPCLFVSEPDLVKLVLVKDFDIFPSRRKFEFGIPVMDNMITVLDGDDKWRNIRNTITPAFSSGKLKAMIPTMLESAELSRKNFMKVAEEGKPIDCKSLFSSYTLDVIAIIAFGTKIDSHNDPNNEFVTQSRKLFSSGFNLKAILAFIFPKLAKSLGIAIFPKETFDFFKDATNSIIKRREETKEVRPDFLQMMIDSRKPVQESGVNHTTESVDRKRNIEKVDQIKRKPLTEDEAMAQCILFFIAGLENTALLIYMVTYYLAVNPDVQEKLLKEVDRIWEKRTTLDGEAMYEAKYTDAVIDEALRLHPPGIRIERRVEKDCVLGETGIPLTKGMHVEIPVYAMHHDPEFFPEPETFRPERFIPREDNEVPPYAYLPFGAGPRNCVAMRLALIEAKICLLSILRSVKFSTCDQTKIPLEFINSPNMIPKDIILNVTSRVWNKQM